MACFLSAAQYLVKLCNRVPKAHAYVCWPLEPGSHGVQCREQGARVLVDVWATIFRTCEEYRRWHMDLSDM